MAPKQPLGNPSPVSSSEDDEEVSSDEEIVEKQEEEKPEEGEEEEGEEEEEEEEETEKEEEEEEEEVDEKETEKEEEEEEEEVDVKENKKEKEEEEEEDEVDEKEKENEKEEEEEEEVDETPQLTKKRPAGTPILPETSKKRRTGLASFHRIWSDEDVIAVLEGMIQFKEEKGADPSTDMAGFLEYIKDAIHISVSKNQMSEKIRSLRKKYQRNAKRVQDVEVPVFSKPHDQNTFRLSKLIWGCCIADKSNNKSQTSGKSLDADEFWTTYPSLNKSMELVPPKHRSSARDAMRLARRSKVKEMDGKWHKFNVKEFCLNMKKTQLFLDVSRAIGFGQGN